MWDTSIFITKIYELIGLAQHIGNLLHMSEGANEILKVTLDSWGYSRENAHYIKDLCGDVVEISTETCFLLTFIWKA